MNLSVCFFRSHFRSVEKATTMSKRIHGGRTCSCKAEVSVFDFNRSKQRAVLFVWSRCFQWPGKRSWHSGSVKGAEGDCRRDTVKNRVQNPETSSVERRQPVSKELAGSCNGALPRASCRQVEECWETATKRLKSNHRQPRLTTITCKSQIIGTLRMSSKIFVEIRIERRMMRCLTWRPPYWSGDYLCRQRWNRQRILAWIMTRLWSCGTTRTSKGSRRCSISLRGWLRRIHSKFWTYLLWCATALRGWGWPCAMIKQSDGRKQRYMYSLIPSCVWSSFRSKR